MRRFTFFRIVLRNVLYRGQLQYSILASAYTDSNVIP